ncbi:hypothetical protein HF521_011899 [Silurus meridionalis]|uniref:Uncharacterized protein n=1 Tax=Silurus meridionalis TaxID=175797 RepID=A0A8T0AF01_SILME|nr:hypothetical protein HF521_011899 [Silurus meridionalis]
MFWRAALPNAETPEHQKEQTLREEVVSLRQKLAEQETTLKDTFETLRNSNRTKDSMEQLIVSQLSRTRDVLKKARSNLEKNELRIESLGCSFSPPSPQSFSFSPRWDDKGQVSNAGFGSYPGPSIVTAPDQAPRTKFSWVTRRFGLQRPLQMCPSSAGSMLQAAAATPC